MAAIMPKRSGKPRHKCVDRNYLESAFEQWGEIFKRQHTLAHYPKLFRDLELDMSDGDTRKALYAAMKAVDRRRDARGECLLSILVTFSDMSKGILKEVRRLLKELNKIRPGMTVGDAFTEQLHRTWNS